MKRERGKRGKRQRGDVNGIVAVKAEKRTEEKRRGHESRAKNRTKTTVK